MAGGYYKSYRPRVKCPNLDGIQYNESNVFIEESTEENINRGTSIDITELNDISIASVRKHLLTEVEEV